MADGDFHQADTQPRLTSSGVAAEIPKQIGPYTIESFLGKGGMSLLYLGLDPESKRALTIKVLAPKHIHNKEAVQRFLREAEIIQMADHPHIVRLLGEGEWEGGLYIAMEFIQGISLRQFIVQNAMSLQRACEVVLQVAEALEHLHAHGVIHRDLKPENILITEEGQVKVIDFGIAQVLQRDNASERVTQTRRVMGTPIYMSPEQREDPKSVVFASDLYSLAIVAYELILGRLSHGVIHLSLMPRGIQKILEKALQPKASRRYQKAVDFIADLRAYLGSAALKQDQQRGVLPGELSERVQRAQERLQAKEFVPAAELDLGVVNRPRLGRAAVFCELYECAHDTYGFVIAEPPHPEGDGVVYLAVLRGILRALSPLTKDLEQLLSMANELLCADPMQQEFRLSYLLLDPIKSELQFASCGHEHLWTLPVGRRTVQVSESQLPPLGRDLHANFSVVRQQWRVGDWALMMSSGLLGDGHAFDAEAINSFLANYTYRSPQSFVDLLFRRMSRLEAQKAAFPSTCLAALRRVN